MHKVMTRAQHQPGTRPPGRRDSRRPGGAPPRHPGGSPARTAPGGGRPPRSRSNNALAGTRPTDSRPPTAGATAARTRTAPARPAPARPAPAPAPAAPERSTTTGSAMPTPHRPRPTDVFADLLVAVLSGQRPVHAMLGHTAGRAYDELAWLAERGPLRARGTRPVVRDIGYYEAGPGAVEAFARIGAGDQLRAMAFRLERGRDLRWRCTAVELGGPRPPHPADD
ncbi:Rv3235 family protein [Streptomyces spinosisporus]|uniref:Rv3235 family protein n=1 Tax=Streptomyces spinosisporus TaxID=2927582 RepID=A0ABS9XSY6_9ACTN|nr:Rv3235 family protein [Streptomyces spinosisporus]MCI3245192.1 Rv3235 family protein [Streptomyces spinosisporus]